MWLRRILASAIILLGVTGLVASLVTGVLFYRVGGFLGDAWGSADAGLKSSSDTLGAAADAVDSAATVIEQVEGGIDATHTALEGINQGLSTAGTTTSRLRDRLEEAGDSITRAGRYFPVERAEFTVLRQSLTSVGDEFRQASTDLEPVQGMWGSGSGVLRG
jgi:hypothetical protein